MVRKTLYVSVLAGLLAACAGGVNEDASTVAPGAANDAVSAAFPGPALRRRTSIAGLADRGSLLEYSRTPEFTRGAATWHAVRLSEEHALNAAAVGGSMALTSPSGRPMRLQYERHVEHPDGSWTWIGHPVGEPAGRKAILTFGEKAVFGTLPDGNEEPLELTTRAGQTWMIQADRRALAAQEHGNDLGGQDAVIAPVASTGSGTRTPGARAFAAAAGPRAADPVPSPVVDLVIGYTHGFALRWGGASQATTRLNFLVDLANQGYAASDVPGRLRLVRAVEVDYPDNTSNRDALYQMTGVQCSFSTSGAVNLPEGAVNCSSAARPAGLQPLVDARDRYGADLVSLVRNFNYPENQSCGTAWLIGGGQKDFDSRNAGFGMSVVSDSGGNQYPDESNTCRNDTLAHETGHNMGLQHNVAAAQGSDDSNSDGNLLDPDEYGRFADSFGYSTDASAGNFYTIMAVRRTGQTGYLVYSNPSITTCGGPCGVLGQANNAATLRITMPIVASFGHSPKVRADFNADGASDVLWRHVDIGYDTIWLSANSATGQAMSGVGPSWQIAGVGDFDGDGRADVFWRNPGNGSNVIWRGGDSGNQQAVKQLSGAAWRVAGVADFNGDGRDDVLWRNADIGYNTIWLSANSSTGQAVTGVGGQAWQVAGVADFDGDGKADILWRNASNGANVIWRGASSSSPQAVNQLAGPWVVAGVADFNADGNADILWRNTDVGYNTIWLSANAATGQAVTGVGSQAWIVAGVGDYDGDGKADILWRNPGTGVNVIWKAANAANQQPVKQLSGAGWRIFG